MNSVKEVLEYFPEEIKNKLQALQDKINKLEEIRVRTNRNILLKIGQEEYMLDYMVGTKEVLEILPANL